MKNLLKNGLRMSHVATLGLLALGLLLTGCQTPTAAKAPRRLLLIAGKPSHPPGMHEFRAGTLLFQSALTGFPGLQVEVYSNGWPTKVEGGQVVPDNSVFAGAAAVVIFADGGGGHPAVQSDRLRFLDQLADRGVGLGFAHYGVEVPAGDPGRAFQKWIGGYYENLYSVNPMWSPRFDSFPQHPVTRGVKPFSTHDEWYFNMRWAEDLQGVTPILTATPADTVRRGPYVWPKGPYDHVVAATGRRETLMWVKQNPQGGRGFGFTGAHTHKNWADANQRKVFLNALVWLTGLEVPRNGVESQVNDALMAANLDPKPQR